MICPIVLFVIGFALFFVFVFVFVFVREGSSLISCAILDSVDNNDGLLSSLSCQSHPLSFYVKQTSFQDSPQSIKVSPGFTNHMHFPHADILLLEVINIKGLIQEYWATPSPHFLRTYCFVQRESTGPGHFLRPTTING